MADIEAELSALLDRKSVDLRPVGDLSRYFLDEVVRAAQMQHAA